MAEKQESTKSKKTREVKDSGQRTVLAAVEYDSHEVAAKLAEAQGIKIDEMEQADPEKGINPFLAQLDVLEGGGVLLWVKLGQVEASTREQAIDAVVGPEVPGSFRAPNASAWRGQINRKPPTQVPLDVEVVD